jgi:MinD superfamily P-loop ATPase
MKEIIIISGKGGTGKTVIAASFAALAKDKVMADCDVDAADLYLLLGPKIKEKGKFHSGATAVIDKDKCNFCGKCLEVCRFSAISLDFTIDSVACEGCAFCSNICPVSAIEMKENLSGQWFISDTRFGPFVHAKLGIAEENSGKLVALVKKKAKEMAKTKKASFVIVDGSPGIGCPVIASLSGADCAIVVTEPTLSGLADAKYCKEDNIDILGKLPFDKSVVEAITVQKTLPEAASDNIKKIVANIWFKLNSQL